MYFPSHLSRLTNVPYGRVPNNVRKNCKKLRDIGTSERTGTKLMEEAGLLKFNLKTNYGTVHKVLVLSKSVC
jgi:hypothetical protein